MLNAAKSKKERRNWNPKAESLMEKNGGRGRRETKVTKEEKFVTLSCCCCCSNSSFFFHLGGLPQPLFFPLKGYFVNPFKRKRQKFEKP
jgi:hypothetical protein